MASLYRATISWFSAGRKFDSSRRSIADKDMKSIVKPMIGIVVLATSSVFADDELKVVTYTAPEKKEITVQNVVEKVVIRSYKRVYELPKISAESEASYETPELAIASHRAALASENESWMDRSYEQFVGKRRTVTTDIDITAFQNRELAERIDRYGRYVFKDRILLDDGLILFLHILDYRTGEDLGQIPYPLKKEGTIWRLNTKVDSRLMGMMLWYYPFEDAEVILVGTELPSVTPKRGVHKSIELDQPLPQVD